METFSLKSILTKGLTPVRPGTDEEGLEELVNWLPTERGLVNLRGTYVPFPVGSYVRAAAGGYYLLYNLDTNVHSIYSATGGLKTFVPGVTPTSTAYIDEFHGGSKEFIYNLGANAGIRCGSGTYATEPVLPFDKFCMFRNRPICGGYRSALAPAISNILTTVYEDNFLSGINAEAIFHGGINESWIGLFDSVSNHLGPFSLTLTAPRFVTAGNYFVAYSGTSYTVAGYGDQPATITTSGLPLTVGGVTVQKYVVTKDGYIAKSGGNGNLYHAPNRPHDVGFHNTESAVRCMCAGDEVCFVYCNNGVLTMYPVMEEPLFSVKRGPQIQPSVNQITCDRDNSLFVDKTKMLHIVSFDGTLNTLDYRWLMEDVFTSITAWNVWFSAPNNGYIISDSVVNGRATKSIIVNQSGACTVSSAIYGTTNGVAYTASSLSTASFMTTPLTFGSDQTKRLKAIKVEASAAVTLNVWAQEDVNSDYRKVATSITPDPSGNYPVNVTGLRFKIEAMASSTTKIFDVKVDVDLNAKSGYSANRRGVF